MRDRRRGAIHDELRKKGLWPTAQDWMRSARKELQRPKYGVKLSRRVRQELLWRMVDLKISEFEPQIIKQVEDSSRIEPVDNSEAYGDLLEWMPRGLMWLLMHPGLNHTDESILDKGLKDACQTYEDMNECPNQGVKNQFELYRGVPDKIEKLFVHRDRLQVERLKAINRAVTPTEIEEEVPDDAKEELEEVVSLEERLTRM